MVADVLQKSKFLLYALYLCYIKFYFDYIIHIYVICFIIYLLYIYMYIICRTLTFQKKLCYLLDWKPFKNDEKCFLFHLKSMFFFTAFWSCWKNGLIRKLRLTSKFMTSQPGLQTNAIYILPNISQSKGNQTMKYFSSKIMQKMRQGD